MPKPKAALTPSTHKAGSVVIGWCRPELTYGAFTRSVVQLLAHDVDHARYLQRPQVVIDCVSGPRVADARNTIVREFLTGTTADWLWMLDVDLSFRADTLDKLMAVAHPKDTPFVAGLYFGRVGINTGIRPVLGVFDGGEVGWVQDYPRGEVVKAHVAGAGCMLMHRSMLEAMQERAGDTYYPWFTEGLQTPKGAPLGEDMAFCLRAHAMDYPLYVHTGVQLGHIKSVELNEDAYWAVKAASA